MSDPPAHTRLRRLVNKAFTPGIVEGMRGHVQEIVDNLLDGIQSKGKADLIAEFSYESPATVISEICPRRMTGIPLSAQAIKDRNEG
jgi:cytochrome P450